MTHFSNSKWQLPVLKVQQLVVLALLMALSIILGRFSINFPFLQISFTFVATTLIAKWYGPWWSIFVAVILDIVKVFLAPSGGTFFLGFTISAALGALIYATAYYQQNEVSWWRTIVAVTLVIVVVNIGMNSLWLNMMYSQIHSWPSLVSFMSPRIIKNILFLPIQVVMTYYLLNNQVVKSITQSIFTK